VVPADEDDIRLPWSRSDRTVPRIIVRPLQEFLQTSTAAAAVLFGAIVLALLWANSPWREGYESLWHTPMTVRIGDIAVGTDLHFWIQDGLMTLFFLLVGLEIKRELTVGELQRLRAAALPVLAAVGGMLAPAVLYLSIAGSGAGRSGWGIPMATDIALALGVLALAASFAPSRLRPLLLTLAIVDDIGAILVIALFYRQGGDPIYVLWGVAATVGVIMSHRLQLRALWVYIALGVVLWYTCYRAGIHPTIAGVILGLLTPVEPSQRPAAVSREARRVAEATSDDPEPLDVDAPEWLELAALSREAVSPLARVEHALLPWSSFIIVPLFALASAGVRLSASTISAAASSVVAIGIVAGLVVGKPLGIWLTSLAAVRTRVGELPKDVTMRSVAGLGATAGIGFTVALFIAELAFPGRPVMLGEAKIAILFASVVAGGAGWVLLRVAHSPRKEPR